MKKIEILRTSFVFLLLFSMSWWVIFWWEILSFWCLSSEKIDTQICDRFSTESLYNQVIVSAKTRNITEAQQLFSRIPSSYFDKKAEYFELAGDLLYKKDDNKISILQNYEKSRVLMSEKRVDDKINLLRNPLQKEEKKSWTGSRDSIASSFSGSHSVIKNEREKIQNDEENRSKFLSFPNMTDSKSILQDTIDFIDTGKERVDW